MTYLEIYHSALRMIGVTESGEMTADYEERAPYLLASFVSQCAPLDRKYRSAHSLDAVVYPRVAAVTMNEEFHLSDVFLSAAGTYLASMLILEENETVSEKLFDQYCDSLASIECALPASSTSIKNCYPGLL